MATVSGRVLFGSDGADAAVVSLIPVTGAFRPAPTTQTIRQEGLAFKPGLTVIAVESTIVFENHDQEMHNVRSASPGNRFDVGLHMPGAVKQVVVAKPGAVRIVCRIHPEMRANILVLATDRFDQTDAAGHFAIADVPPGKYRAEVWHARLTPEERDAAARALQVGAAGVKIDFSLEPAAPPTADLVDVPSKNWAPLVGEIEASLAQAFERWSRGATTAAQLKVRATQSRLYHETGFRAAIAQRLGGARVARTDQGFDRMTSLVNQSKLPPDPKVQWEREHDALMTELRSAAAELAPVGARR